jgi:hypothetical protein
MKQENQRWHTNIFCLYCGEPGHVAYECLNKCEPHVACAIFVINTQSKDSENEHV